MSLERSSRLADALEESVRITAGKTGGQMKGQGIAHGIGGQAAGFRILPAVFIQRILFRDFLPAERPNQQQSLFTGDHLQKQLGAGNHWNVHVVAMPFKLPNSRNQNRGLRKQIVGGVLAGDNHRCIPDGIGRHLAGRCSLYPEMEPDRLSIETVIGQRQRQRRFDSFHVSATIQADHIQGKILDRTGELLFFQQFLAVAEQGRP